MRSEGEGFTKNESGGPWEACGRGGCRIICDLPDRQAVDAGRIAMALMIPFHGVSNGLLKIPNGLPLEQVPGLVGGKIEQGGFVNGMRV